MQINFLIKTKKLLTVFRQYVFVNFKLISLQYIYTNNEATRPVIIMRNKNMYTGLTGITQEVKGLYIFTG